MREEDERDAGPGDHPAVCVPLDRLRALCMRPRPVAGPWDREDGGGCDGGGGCLYGGVPMSF